MAEFQACCTFYTVNKFPYSPVENQNDLELDFKVFFFDDSFCSGIVLDESNWCHSGIIERFELLKMASKMADSKAPKTYMTQKLDQKHFNFDYLWAFRSKIIQTIKMDHVFD